MSVHDFKYKSVVPDCHDFYGRDFIVDGRVIGRIATFVVADTELAVINIDITSPADRSQTLGSNSIDIDGEGF